MLSDAADKIQNAANVEKEEVNVVCLEDWTRGRSPAMSPGSQVGVS